MDTPPASLRATFIGTATLLLEVQCGERVVRLLTDPVFDGPGPSYTIGGVGALRYTRTQGPALPAEALPPIDAVLLSHDQHGDNLDPSGREVAARAGRVLTTPQGAARLRRQGLASAEGLRTWASSEWGAPELRIRVTATPARHGPPLSLPVVGHVTGFLVEWTGQQGGPLWISGDTVWHRALAPLAERRIGVAVLHVGAAAVRATPWFRVTFDAREAALAAERLRPHTVCPVHYEGWSHFNEGQAEVERALAKRGLRDRAVWLPPGLAVALHPRSH